MKTGAIIQARMSSQRLPNKVLHEVSGKPVLQYLLERLYHCDCLDGIVVATSTDDSDTPVADFCRRQKVACFRGHLDDVARRFCDVLSEYGFEAFIRVTGDSPLLDQRLVEKGVRLFLGGDCDLATNVMPRTYPKGQSVEVLNAATYRRAYPLMQEAEDKEHVTLYYHKHPEEFRIKKFTLPESLNHIQLSVDTRQDMADFEKIISMMTRPHWEYDLEDLLRIYRSLKSPEVQPR